MHEIVPLQLSNVLISISIWVPYCLCILVPRSGERHRVLELIPHQGVINLDFLTIVIDNRDAWAVNDGIRRNDFLCPIPVG